MSILVEPKILKYKPIVITTGKEANFYIWNITKTSVSVYSDPAELIKLNEDKLLHVWAEPGKYRVDLLAIGVDWDLKKIFYTQDKAEFEVVESLDDNITSKVKFLLSTLTPPVLQDKNKVAQVYANIANEAETSPGRWTVEMMVDEAKVRSMAINTAWEQFWFELMTFLRIELNLQDNDLTGYIEVYREISDII
jgi:hypothetical protein